MPDGATDILIVTQEIFNSLRDKGLDEDTIYYTFKKKGLGQMASELSDVSDFSALTAQIVE